MEDRAELAHYGILGMKWGVRNGPPYPLGASDHSASEKKAHWRKSLDKGSPQQHNRKRPTSSISARGKSVSESPSGDDIERRKAIAKKLITAGRIAAGAYLSYKVATVVRDNPEILSTGKKAVDSILNTTQTAKALIPNSSELVGKAEKAVKAAETSIDAAHAVEAARKAAESVPHLTVDAKTASVGKDYTEQILRNFTAYTEEAAKSTAQVGAKAVQELFQDIDDLNSKWLNHSEWTDELFHHGILGMKWGKRNGPPYPLGASDHSASEKKAHWRKSLDSDSPQRYNRNRSASRVSTSGKSTSKHHAPRSHEGAKKALKTGAILTGTALAAYGLYKLNESGALDPYIAQGKQAVNALLGNGAPRWDSTVNTGRSAINDILGGMTNGMPNAGNTAARAAESTVKNASKTTAKIDPKTGFKLTKETLNDSLKAANPLRGTKEGENNCTFCAVAGFLRSKGYDVTAKSTGGRMQLLGGVIEDCFKGAKVLDAGAAAFARSPEDAAQLLKKRFGDNASGAVGVPFKGDMGGHTFSWTIKDGIVEFLDYQQNTRGESAKVYWRMIDPNGRITMARLDNAEINLDTIDKYVNR